MAEHIQFSVKAERQVDNVEKPLRPTKGRAGFYAKHSGMADKATQLPGCATTVGNIASATGGIAPGNIISTDK